MDQNKELVFQVMVDDATLTILKSDGTIFKQISPTAGDRLTYY